MSDQKKSKKQFVRIWVELDMANVRKHLIISDETIGSCANCKEVGFNIVDTKHCPHCNTEFQYITARPRGFKKSVDPRILSRIRDKRPDLTLLDWADFDHGEGKVSAREFLNL